MEPKNVQSASVAIKKSGGNEHIEVFGYNRKEQK